MEALFLLVPLSVVLVAIAVLIFLACAESGLFEDLEGPAMRILTDDDRAELDPAGGPAGHAGGG